MNPLHIYFNSANQVNLTGETDAVITGCRYAPGHGQVGNSPAGETVTEQLDLILKGTWSDICARVFTLEKYLELARQEVVKKDYVYLRFYDSVSGYDWRSRILGGRLEFGSKGLVDRDTESQHVILTVMRLNYWFKPRCIAPVFSYGVIEPFLEDDPIPIYGFHIDGTVDGYVNCFGLCGHLSEGDLPSPVELVISNPYGADAIRNMTISQRILPGTVRTDFLILEDESLIQGADSTLANVGNGSCTAGSMAMIQWSGTAESQLFTVPYVAPALNVLRGQVQRGIVRLANPIAYTDLWVCLKALYPGTSTVLAESLWCLVPAGTKYFELPPLAMPPGLAGSDSYNRTTIALYARRATAGNHRLDIDFIQFSPAESLRHLTDLTNGGVTGGSGSLVDSGIDEVCYFKTGAGAKETTHIGTGRFLNVIPGYDSMVRIVHRPGGDATWTITVKVLVAIYYEPRRRSL
jgi:hypothetical protein